MPNSSNHASCAHAKYLRQGSLTLVLLAVFFANDAFSQQAVAVTDRAVENNTSDIKSNTSDIKTNTGNISKQIGGSTSGGSDTVNGHLKNIDTLGAAPSSALSTLANPDLDMNTVSRQSRYGESCSGLAAGQQQDCQDIVITKNAQLSYMKAIYDMAVKRQTTLNDLQSSRSKMTSEDFGKLQDNTNQVLTLIAQMQIDRQQMESVNGAYSARLAYLQNHQTRLAKSATEPSSAGLISNIASQAIAGFVLKTALDIQSSGDSKPLSIEHSSGW